MFKTIARYLSPAIKLDFKNKELDRKVIESLLLKGYNYKSIKNVVEGMNEND